VFTGYRKIHSNLEELQVVLLFICIKRFIENEFTNAALHLMNTVWLINIYFHCRLIISVCNVYTVIVYVLYDGVCMYKSPQI